MSAMFTFKYLPSIAALCAAAAAPAQAILETFANATQQDAQVSSGVWSGGARPGLIGGDGRHGPFYPFLGFALGGNVFELNTDHTVIPATTSSTGLSYTVTDGRFYFTDFVVPAGVTIRFRGSSPPVIRVRGDVFIAGTIDVAAADLPAVIQTSGPATGLRVSTFNARVNVLAFMPGTAGGPGGGRGGDGGREGTDQGPTIIGGVNVNDGQQGEDVRVVAGHAYAGNVAGTGGLGSQMSPASGSWSFPLPLLAGVYCAHFSPGGSGGGFRGPGNQADVPLPTNSSYTIAATPIVAGGAAFPLFPYPPSSVPTSTSSLEHFLVGGSGGGGGGSHGYGLIGIGPPSSLNERWMRGHAGSGGGGAAAIRCGGDMTVTATATLCARGGDGVIISGDDPNTTTTTNSYGISSPGGGGSGGSFVLQAGGDLAVAGEIDARGGRGSENGYISNNIQSMDGKGGDGADGFFRLESNASVSFSGTSTPSYLAGDNSGPLTDRDDRVGDRSEWYFVPPATLSQWSGYELDVDLDGDGAVDVTYSDSGAPGAQLAFSVGGPATTPVQVEFQSATAQPGGGIYPASVGPWRAAVGNAVATGVVADGGDAVRFRLTYNRSLFPDQVLTALRILYVGPTLNATASVYGAGCGSPALSLVPGSPPIIGAVASAQLVNPPSFLCAFGVGLDDVMLGGQPVLPLDLSALGMPGCSLLHSADAVGLSGTSFGLQLPIPNSSSLWAQRVFVQAYCYAPGANAAEVITSNGVDWRIGNQ